MPHLRGQAVKVLRLFESLGWDEVRRRLGGREPGEGWSVPALVERRPAAFGPAMTPPTYREPLHLVRGDGVWLIDADGRRYLDAYNNVPVVGHEHPRVVEAIVRQARRLNTNMRYLHETALEVAERLIATTGGALDTVMFVNSGLGGERHRVAHRARRDRRQRRHHDRLRLPRHHRRDQRPDAGGLGRADAPEHVRTWRPPDRLRGFDGSLDDFDRALGCARRRRSPARGRDHGRGPDERRDHRSAAGARGRARATDARCRRAVDRRRGPVGARPHRRRDVGLPAPGHRRRTSSRSASRWATAIPVAAVITRRELAERFSPDGEFFSTFGGNPVAMAARAGRARGHGRRADHRERRVRSATYLGDRLRELAATHPMIGEVRQIGLAIGVEIVRPASTEPDAATAKDIVEGMRRARRPDRHDRPARQRRSRSGRHSSSAQHADQVAQTLERVLRSAPYCASAKTVTGSVKPLNACEPRSSKVRPLPSARLRVSADAST